MLVCTADDFPTDRYVVAGVADARGMTVREIDADLRTAAEPAATSRFLDLFDIAKPSAPSLANTAALLDHALHGAAVIGTDSYSIGQFMPGAAGGANSSSGLASTFTHTESAARDMRRASRRGG